MLSNNHGTGQSLTDQRRAARRTCLRQLTLIFESMDSVLSQIELLKVLADMGESAPIPIMQLIDKWEQLWTELLFVIEIIKVLEHW